METVRIDKYLWAVRIFKTRSQATAACRRKAVWVNGEHVKASFQVSSGMKICVKQTPIIRSYIIKGLLEKRVSATIARENVKETTPESEILRLKEIKKAPMYRKKGSGRPTKKERRQLDKINPKS